MPRLSIDYSNTIIYKIVCKDVNIKECYVGQTTDFTERKSCHKKCCNNINNKLHNMYIYQFIRDHNGWDNWDMIEIEKYNAIDKLDAKKKERYWIETLQATLNKQIPTRTKKEYYVDNKDKFIEYKKEWYIDNREKIKEDKKEYYEDNKDKFKDKNKEYRKLNKDKIKEHDRNYYEQNKSKILEKITCICGSVCSKAGIRRHEQTIKHIDFVKTI